MEDELNNIINNYKPSPETVSLVSRSKLLLIVGISGAGKGSIKHKLLQTGKYFDFISHTTREPRSNNGVMEVDGKDYNFISKGKALEMLKNGDYIEAKKYSGNIYGTSVEGLIKATKSQKIAINDIEVQGVDEYKSISEDVIAIFILPPNYQEWQRRLLMRYGDGDVSNDNIGLRIKTSIEELKIALSRDYFHFVINDNLDEAVDACDKIAHSGNKFFNKDAIARRVAQDIHDEIQKNLSNT